MTMQAPDAALIERFSAIVGPGNALTPPADLTHYTEENRHIFTGRTPLVLRPGSTAEVAAIMALAHETGTAIVPQGGNTGHAAGGSPDETGTQVVVSLERMNKVRDIDLAGNTATVEAGMILQNLQALAASHERLFPLSLASQGSCMIGGNIGSNAGGTGVLAYGNTRELVLGLEVVLPSGDVWNGLKRLKKDNTGYSLRNLFVGSEGTLGIVTAAVVKLFPMPKGREMAFAGLASPKAALELFNLALGLAGPSLTAFELIARRPLDFLLEAMPSVRDPLPTRHDWYVLAEISSGRSAEDARELIETIFAQAIEAGYVEDAALAGSFAQGQAFWKMREDMPGAQAPQGASIKHDISVPVHLVPAFLERADALVMAAMPQARICSFGHMGDGNIHYNVSQPKGGDAKSFMARREELNDIVHALVVSLGGSISAEHGIGRLKRDMLARVKSPVEMAMMRAIKQALDPSGIMNPGKLL